MKGFCCLYIHILKSIPPTGVEGAVRRLSSEQQARGVSCWQRFVAMIFRHFGGARSLGEVGSGTRSREGELEHLGVERAGRSARSWRRSTAIDMASCTGTDFICSSRAVSRHRRGRAEANGNRVCLVTRIHGRNSARVAAEMYEPMRCPRYRWA
ncbi:MAG: DUF4372 domain-containing protein [Steroidobacteraceae bacterium]